MSTNIKLQSKGLSCNAGMLVDFVYDSGTHLPTHAAVKGGERRGLCGVKPGRSPSTCNNPEGGLCHRCATQVEKVGGVWRVKIDAPNFNARPYDDIQEDRCWADDD